MNIWVKMLNVDRRWVFLLIGVVAIVPFLFPVGMPITTTSEVESIYDCIDSLGSENAIFIGFDFDPGTDAENMPMSVAVLRHAFHRNIPVFMTAYTPLGHGMMMSGFEYVTDSAVAGSYTPVHFGDWATYRDAGITERSELLAAWEADGHVLPESSAGWVFEGRDYVLLGYMPLFHLVILGMTSSIEAQYPSDTHGNATGEMPMLNEHKSLREVDLAVTMAGSSACTSWIFFGREKIGLQVAFGVTAVMATDYFPFIQSNQIIGQMGGLRGAAEYEVLMQRNGVTADTDKAFTGMDVQSAAHILIIILITLGNVAYFAGGFHKQHQLKSGR